MSLHLSFPGECTKVMSPVYGCGIIRVPGYGYQTFLTFQVSNITVLTCQCRTNCCVKETTFMVLPISISLWSPFPPNLSKCHLCIGLGNVKQINELQIVI